MARITQLGSPKATLRFGGLEGKVRIAEEFDAPLPDAVVAAFEGR